MQAPRTGARSARPASAAGHVLDAPLVGTGLEEVRRLQVREPRVVTVGLEVTGDPPGRRIRRPDRSPHLLGDAAHELEISERVTLRPVLDHEAVAQREDGCLDLLDRGSAGEVLTAGV